MSLLKIMPSKFSLKKVLTIILSAFSLFNMCNIVCANNSRYDILLSLGIVQGDENHDLQLKSNITRAEFATLYVNWLLLTQPRYKDLIFEALESNSLSNPYKDINESDWFYNSAIIIYYHGGVYGYSENMIVDNKEFHPYENLNILDLYKAFNYITNEFNDYDDLTYKQSDTVNKKNDFVLTREDVFDLFLDVITSPVYVETNIHDCISPTYQENLAYMKPKRVLQDSILSNGDASGYITPLIKNSMYFVYGKFKMSTNNKLYFCITDSINFNGFAYGEMFNSPCNVDVVQSYKYIPDTNYTLLLRQSDEEQNSYDVLYFKEGTIMLGNQVKTSSYLEW